MKKNILTIVFSLMAATMGWTAGYNPVLYNSTNYVILNTNLLQSNILAGANVTITVDTNGRITIANPGTGGSNYGPYIFQVATDGTNFAKNAGNLSQGSVRSIQLSKTNGATAGYILYTDGSSNYWAAPTGGLTSNQVYFAAGVAVTNAGNGNLDDWAMITTSTLNNYLLKTDTNIVIPYAVALSNGWASNLTVTNLTVYRALNLMAGSIPSIRLTTNTGAPTAGWILYTDGSSNYWAEAPGGLTSNQIAYAANLLITSTNDALVTRINSTNTGILTTITNLSKSSFFLQYTNDADRLFTAGWMLYTDGTNNYWAAAPTVGAANMGITELTNVAVVKGTEGNGEALTWVTAISKWTNKAPAVSLSSADGFGGLITKPMQLNPVGDHVQMNTALSACNVNGGTNAYYWIGDSETGGNGIGGLLTNCWPKWFTNLYVTNFHLAINLGENSMQVSHFFTGMGGDGNYQGYYPATNTFLVLTGTPPSTAYYRLHLGGTNSRIAVELGLNDILGGTNALVVYNGLTNIWGTLRTNTGLELMACTIPLPTTLMTVTGGTTNAMALNALIRSNTNLYNSLLELDLIWSSAHLLYDGLHFNESAQQIAAQQAAWLTVKGTINGLGLAQLTNVTLSSVAEGDILQSGPDKKFTNTANPTFSGAVVSTLTLLGYGPGIAYFFLTNGVTNLLYLPMGTDGQVVKMQGTSNIVWGTDNNSGTGGIVTNIVAGTNIYLTSNGVTGTYTVHMAGSPSWDVANFGILNVTNPTSLRFTNTSGQTNWTAAVLTTNNIWAGTGITLNRTNNDITISSSATAGTTLNISTNGAIAVGNNTNITFWNGTNVVIEGTNRAGFTDIRINASGGGGTGIITNISAGTNIFITSNAITGTYTINTQPPGIITNIAAGTNIYVTSNGITGTYTINVANPNSWDTANFGTVNVTNPVANITLTNPTIKGTITGPLLATNNIWAGTGVTLNRTNNDITISSSATAGTTFNIATNGAIAVGNNTNITFWNSSEIIADGTNRSGFTDISLRLANPLANLTFSNATLNGTTVVSNLTGTSLSLSNAAPGVAYFSATDSNMASRIFTNVAGVLATDGSSNIFWNTTPLTTNGIRGLITNVFQPYQYNLDLWAGTDPTTMASKTTATNAAKTVLTNSLFLMRSNYIEGSGTNLTCDFNVPTTWMQMSNNATMTNFTGMAFDTSRSKVFKFEPLGAVRTLELPVWGTNCSIVWQTNSANMYPAVGTLQMTNGNAYIISMQTFGASNILAAVTVWPK